MFEHPHELRHLADWYRDLAQLAGELERKWFMNLVDFLEQRATEIEDSRNAVPVVSPDYCYPQGLLAPANT